MEMPSTSEGSMSLVNCTLWKLHSRARAIACPRVVLPTPGTPSISKWPRASRETTDRRTISSLPRMTLRSAFSSSVARDETALAVSGDIRRRFYNAERDRVGYLRHGLGYWLLAFGSWPNPDKQAKSCNLRANSQEPTAKSQWPHFYCINSAGRPVSRSIRLAMGGCVENRLPKLIPPSRG